MRYITFILLALTAFATAEGRQKQPVDLSLLLGFDYDLSKQYMWRHFVAKSEKAIAYQKNGYPVPLSTTDTITVTSAETGSYKGHTGTWLKPAGSRRDNLYIFLNDDLKDVTEEVRARNRAIQDGLVKDRIMNVCYASIPFLLIALVTALVSPKRVRLPDFLRVRSTSKSSIR